MTIIFTSVNTKSRIKSINRVNNILSLTGTYSSTVISGYNYAYIFTGNGTITFSTAQTVQTLIVGGGGGGGYGGDYFAASGGGGGGFGVGA